MSVYLRQIPLGPMENFVYLLGPAGSPDTAVVDPAWDVPALLETAARDGRRITHALVTHHHFDHTNGLPDLLAQAPDVRIHAHAGDRPWLKDFAGEVCWVGAGEKVDVGGLPIECVHTPGHTPGSQCFHIPGTLISGDTLFIGGCGRCDLPGGDPAEMFETLTRRLARVEDRTVLLPGHDYADRPTSTLGDERSQNPYLQLHDLESFLGLRMRPRR